MARSRQEVEAELAVLDLEEELAAAKENPPDSGEFRELKLRLRQARWVHRTLREGNDPEDGVARPATVAAAAGVGSAEAEV